MRCPRSGYPMRSLASALMFALASLSARRLEAPAGLGVGAGIVIAAFHALTWPHCLQRPEGIRPKPSDCGLAT